MNPRNFFAELKRRNVVRMAGLYLVGAWLLVQVTGTVLPMFGAAEWLPRSIAILLAMGFVPALIFSWVFELTPQGLKRDEDVTPEQSIAPQTARRMDRMIIVVLLVALGYFAFDKFALAPRRTALANDFPSGASTKSIAVLPFENLSSDKENAYFAEGIQDEILTRLAKVAALKVISRNAEVLQLLGFAAARLGEWKKSDDAFDQAVVLNPRDLATRRWALNNRLDARDFMTARRLTDEALQIWPDEPNLLGYKAQTYQALGQLDEARAILSQVKPRLKDYDALSTLWYQAKPRRDPAPVIKILEPLALPTDSGFDWMFNAAQLGDLQALSGDNASSQSNFRLVRDRAAALAHEQPENVRYLGLLAQALSHLGEKEATLRVIDRAMELRAGDLRNQPSVEEQRARILTLFGEKDQAIEILPRLLQTRYSGWATAPLTPALLRLDPDFDLLRSDPRFQKLCDDKPK